MIRLRLDSRRASLPFFASALLVLTLAACAKKQERPPRPVATVTVAPVRRATVPYVIEANGIVTPLQTASVLPQVDGIITSVDFEEGQDVSAGQPLFHIDARPYKNAYDNALAVLARDSASAANASDERARYQKLLAGRVVTPEEAGVQFTASATSDATVLADRANVATAKFNLENAVVRAPISGKTGALLIRQGNLVHAAGGQPLVTINQVRPILVRFAIPSAQLGLILQYGAKGGLPVAAVPGGVASPSPSIDSLAASVMNPVQDGASPADGGVAGGFSAASGGSGGGSGGGFTPGGSAPGGGTPPVRGGAGTAAASTGGPNAGNAAASGRGRHGGGHGSRGNNAGSNGSTGPSGNTGASGSNGSGGGSAQSASGVVTQAGLPAPDRLMGKLSFIDNAVDTTTGTVQLKAVFDNDAGKLWVGQFAATSLHLFDEQDALVVPTQAVVTGQRGTYVYVVDPSDTARQRAVVVERTSGSLSVISSGLHDGDEVVTDGQTRLSPDAPVKLRGASDGATSGGSGRRGGKGGRRGGKGAGSGGGGSNPSGSGS
jgi:multidrug efflux pump subunit AcrA (membrane-fusion protein)